MGQPGGQPGSPWGAPPPTGKKPLGKGLIAAIAGGAVVVIAVIVVLILVFAGGGNGGGSSSDDPKTVAKAYLAAASDFDFEKACGLLSSSAQKDLLSAAKADDCSGVEKGLSDQFSSATGGAMSFDTFTKDLDISTTVGDVHQSGDSATVAYTAKMTYTGDNESLKSAFQDEDTSTDDDLHLVKEDGAWKVKEAGDLDFADLGSL